MAFGSSKKGVSLFEWSSALSYDWRERGVTMGLVGFTTGCNGKDTGDAFPLLKLYASLGGPDLTQMAEGCTRDKTRAAALIAKIQEIGRDPKWIEAQWRSLFVKGGYFHETMSAWKKVGVERPSALAIATVFCTSLNQGWDGPDGGCTYLVKLGVAGNEDATLAKYNAWRRKVAGTNDYNSPPINGANRADQYEKLRVAKMFSLDGPDATAAIKSAISWTMK